MGASRAGLLEVLLDDVPCTRFKMSSVILFPRKSPCNDAARRHMHEVDPTLMPSCFHAPTGVGMCRHAVQVVMVGSHSPKGPVELSET